MQCSGKQLHGIVHQCCLGLKQSNGQIMKSVVQVYIGLHHYTSRDTHTYAAHTLYDVRQSPLGWSSLRTGLRPGWSHAMQGPIFKILLPSCVPRPIEYAFQVLSTSPQCRPHRLWLLKILTRRGRTFDRFNVISRDIRKGQIHHTYKNKNVQIIGVLTTSVTVERPCRLIENSRCLITLTLISLAARSINRLPLLISSARIVFCADVPLRNYSLSSARIHAYRENTGIIEFARNHTYNEML